MGHQFKSSDPYSGLTSRVRLDNYQMDQEVAGECSLPAQNLINSTFLAKSVFLDISLNYSDHDHNYQSKGRLGEEESVNLGVGGQMILESQSITLTQYEDMDMDLVLDRNDKEYEFLRGQSEDKFRGPNSHWQGQDFSQIIPPFRGPNSFGLLQIKMQSIQSFVGVMEESNSGRSITQILEQVHQQLQDSRAVQTVGHQNPPQVILGECRPPLEVTNNAYGNDAGQFDFDDLQSQIMGMQKQLASQISLDSQIHVQLIKMSSSRSVPVPMTLRQQTHLGQQWVGALNTFSVSTAVQTQSQFEQYPNSVDRAVGDSLGIVQEATGVVQIVDHIIPDIVKFPVDLTEIGEYENMYGVQQSGQAYTQPDNWYDKFVSENNFLRDQVITLIDQLDGYKGELDRERNRVAELELRASNAAARDFYKLKITDLERIITQKSVTLSQLDDSIRKVEDRGQNNDQMSRVIAHYEACMTRLHDQIASLKTRLEEQGGQKQSVQNNCYIQDIQIQEREIQFLTKQIREHQRELCNQRQVNRNLKEIVDKLTQESQESTARMALQEAVSEKLQEEESRLHDDKQDIDYMNGVVATLTEQICLIKRELCCKQQQQLEDKSLIRQNQDVLGQYQEQILVQSATIQQFQATVLKSQQYISALNEEIRTLRQEAQNTDNQVCIQNNLDRAREFKAVLHRGDDYGSRNWRHQDSPQDHSFSSISSSVNEGSGFARQLHTNEFNSELFSNLVCALKEAQSDMEVMEGLNNHLKDLLVQYQKLVQLQDQHQPEGTSKLQYSQRQMVLVLTENQRLEKQLEDAGSSSIDLQLFEQIVNQLERTKLANTRLLEKMERMNQDLVHCETQIFQKTETINYLNLALIKISGEASVHLDPMERGGQRQTSLESQLLFCRTQLKKALEVNQTLQASIQRLAHIKNQEIRNLTAELQTLQTLVIPGLNNNLSQLEVCLENAERTLRNKQDQVCQLLKGRREQHSKSAINILQKVRPNNDSQILRVPVGDSMRKLNSLQKGLDQIKRQNISPYTLMYIMYRVAELVHESAQKGVFKQLSPKSIVIFNFSQQKPELIQVTTLSENPEETQLFSAPEVLSGESVSEQSCSWNVGVLFDYLINGCSFFACAQQIKKQGPYSFLKKGLDPIRHIVQSLVVNDPKSRLGMSKCVQLLKRQLSRV